MRIVLEIETFDLPDNGEIREHVKEVIVKCLEQQFCKELKVPIKFTTWTAGFKIRELDESDVDSYWSKEHDKGS